MARSVMLALVAALAMAGGVAAAAGDVDAPRRALLDIPCCGCLFPAMGETEEASVGGFAPAAGEDCSKSGNDVAVFNCFRNCQDCVSGSACLELSQDVAGRVAQVACSYAADQCGAGAAAAAAFQVPREQCYRAAKNVCLTYGRSYAESGSGSCSGYNNGAGQCDANQFRNYFNSKLNSLCDSIAVGIAISLP